MQTDTWKLTFNVFRVFCLCLRCFSSFVSSPFCFSSFCLIFVVASLFSFRRCFFCLSSVVFRHFVFVVFVSLFLLSCSSLFAERRVWAPKGGPKHLNLCQKEPIQLGSALQAPTKASETLDMATSSFPAGKMPCHTRTGRVVPNVLRRVGH